MKRFTKSGFTLIELLVVIAIIAILAAILFPVFARVRENARKSACQSNLKQLALGFHQYVQDYDGYYPWAYDHTEASPGSGYGSALVTTPTDAPLIWPAKILPYVKSRQLFSCPSITRSIDYPHCGTNAVVPIGWKESDPVYPNAGYVAYGYNNFYLGGGTGAWLQCAHVAAPAASGAGCYTCTTATDANLASAASTMMLIDNNVANSGSSALPAVARMSINADPGGDLNCTVAGAFDAYDSFDGRHGGGMNLAFCDGHVKWMKKDVALYVPPGGVASCYSGNHTSTDERFIWNRL